MNEKINFFKKIHGKKSMGKTLLRKTLLEKTLLEKALLGKTLLGKALLGTLTSAFLLLIISMSPAEAQHGDNSLDLPIRGPIEGLAEDPDSPEEDPLIKLYDEELPTKEESIIFVLDISGSMGWGSSAYTGLDGNPSYGSRLDRAKCELSKAVAALTPQYSFNVIGYHCAMRLFAGERVKATAENKTSAISWVNSLYPGGGTGTGPAGALGLTDKENYTLVMLSDGGPNCGASGQGGHLAMILNANSQSAIIHTFGIAPSSYWEPFLKSIAASTGGTYHAVP